MTPAGIEPSTFRFVAQHLNHCATAVPARNMYRIIIINVLYKVIVHQVGHLPRGLTFNSCTLCRHCIYAFYFYLRTNSDLCHLQHKLIGFYNRDEKCLQRGTVWVCK